MKKLLPLGLIMLTASTVSAQSDVPSQVFAGEYLYCVSDNGEWAVGQMEQQYSVYIRNLITGKVWQYEWDGSDLGEMYTLSLDKAVSNNGIVIGEISDTPVYWKEGRWHALPTSGFSASCQLGSISADGSMIVGGIGDVGFNYDDQQMTFPCVWYMQDNGNFGNPEFLPRPEKDMTGATPQYFSCISVSEDGNVIGATMTCNYGFPHVPYVYIKGSDGSWSYKALGLDLINPGNLQFPEYVGEYNGPDRPNYEAYMTQEQIAKMDAEFPAWSAAMEREGYTQEDIEILMLRFAADYMTEPEKSEYEAVLDEYYDAYFDWLEKYTDYETTLGMMLAEGVDFVFNNIRISPDGKYVYSTGSRLEMVRPDDPENAFDELHFPTRFDVETSDSFEFDNSLDILVSCVTADYSVLGQPFILDADMYREAYIFPQGAFKPMNFYEYYMSQNNEDAAKWIEKNMLKEVIGFGPNGNITIIDTLCMGMPTATPDMSLVTFTTSGVYWEPQAPFNWYSYILNPLAESGIETAVTEDGAKIISLADARLSVSGKVKEITVYDLSGAAVYFVKSPAGIVSTGLPSGVYVVKAVKDNDESMVLKVLF